MIEFHIPEKRCQCQFCGRIKVGKEWLHVDLMADVVGMCPRCLDWRKKAADHKAVRMERWVRQRAKAGLQPGEHSSDPFR